MGLEEGFMTSMFALGLTVMIMSGFFMVIRQCVLLESRQLTLHRSGNKGEPRPEWLKLVSEAELAFPEVCLSEELTCVICLDNLHPDVPARKLSCGHAFHASCVGGW
ncbi:unnamed protein product [Polarella glacialis]|uniref:RING-type domain-containing protein n=1 Tax=Polarella glacialis TaxID=89957 RepID=A0A813EGW9_POLGL|nr:unnamed protein product [Polarella glacialis]